VLGGGIRESGRHRTRGVSAVLKDNALIEYVSKKGLFIDALFEEGSRERVKIHYLALASGKMQSPGEPAVAAAGGHRVGYFGSEKSHLRILS
jgi:hypothetical protein